MGIRKKLLLSYFSIVILILVIGLIDIYNTRVVYLNGNEIYVNNLKSVEYLKSINQNVKQMDQCLISMMTNLNLGDYTNYEEEIQQLQADNKALMEKYSGLKVTDLEERRYNQSRLSILSLDKQIASVVDMVNSGDVEGAMRTYQQELIPVKACTYELIDAVVDLSTENAQAKNEESRKIHERLTWVIGIIMALAIVVAIAISMRMSNYFISKLAAIQRLAKRLSEYDISDDIQGVENDEFGETMEALNESQFMIRDLMEKIIDESATISDTGEEVSLAVRKSGQRIENVNVQLLQSGEQAEETGEIIQKLLENRSLDDATVEMLKKVHDLTQEEQERLLNIRSELSGTAMYLEQIGITSDYQNEMANSHREQVKKFKV
jgi:methyl-accepting chemotaxis protein